jgi:hypothetical protein
MEWLNRIPLKTNPSRPRRSPRRRALRQNEISEIHKATGRRRRPKQLAQAKLDNDIEGPPPFSLKQQSDREGGT